MSLEAGGGIPCRPNSAATLLVIDDGDGDGDGGSGVVVMVIMMVMVMTMMMVSTIAS